LYLTTFTTAAATLDTTPPTVTSTNPSNGATSVSISQTILVTFSKPIASATINSTNITLMQGVTPITGTVYAVGTNGAVFQPTSTLAYNTNYTLNLTSAITDTASTPNALANTSISFTTAIDVIAFTVSSVSPSTSSTNISPFAGIMVTFNKSVNTATLIAANITLTSSGSFFTTPLTITPIGTSSVLILPNSPMTNFTLHTLQLTSAILDSNGNALSVTPYTSVFTTSSESGADGGSVAVISGPLVAAFGYINATGTAALFNNPEGIAIDTTGNFYVTDQTNHAIKAITY